MHNGTAPLNGWVTACGARAEGNRGLRPVRRRGGLDVRNLGNSLGTTATKLPFADAAFDLVTSRHPSAVWWDEIARVLTPGGTYFAQHVGVIYLRKLIESFVQLPPRGPIRGQSDPDTVTAEVAAAGLDVVDLRHEQIRLEFFDVGAVIYFLRKLSWVVPGFAVAKYRDKLREMHQLIEAEGAFVTHSSRVLIEARKPA